MKKRTVAIAILILLLLIGGTVWAIHSRKNAKVREMLAKGQTLFENGRPEPEQMQAFREEMEQLTPDQQAQLREAGRRTMERRRDKQIADFFALPPDQQTASLTKQIQDQEKRRQEWEARRAEAEKNQTATSGGTTTGGQGPGAGGQGGQGGWARGQRNQSADARATQRNQRLDSSTPEQRAQRNAYHAAMQQQRVQMGLPATPSRGGR